MSKDKIIEKEKNSGAGKKIREDFIRKPPTQISDDVKNGVDTTNSTGPRKTHDKTDKK